MSGRDRREMGSDAFLQTEMGGHALQWFRYPFQREPAMVRTSEPLLLCQVMPRDTLFSIKACRVGGTALGPLRHPFKRFHSIQKYVQGHMAR